MYLLFVEIYMRLFGAIVRCFWRVGSGIVNKYPKFSLALILMIGGTLGLQATIESITAPRAARESTADYVYSEWDEETQQYRSVTWAEAGLENPNAE